MVSILLRLQWCRQRVTCPYLPYFFPAIDPDSVVSALATALLSTFEYFASVGATTAAPVVAALNVAAAQTAPLTFEANPYPGS